MKGHSINFLCIIILVLAVILCGNFSYAAPETTIEKILASKDSYDGKEVLVSGTVSSPKFKASRAGKTYMTFPLLGDSGGRINILFWGDMKLKPGKKIMGKGIYRKIMEMGKYTFRDVIEASEIKADEKE
jgi:hypothetical protein